MKIVLIKKVDGLGEEGEERIVKAGYGRNYLIPQGFALIFDDFNARAIVREKEDKINNEKKEQRAIPDKIDIDFQVKTKKDGKTFVGITKKKIIDRVHKDYNLKISKLKLSKTIKEIGENKIEAILADGSKVMVTVLIKEAK